MRRWLCRIELELTTPESICALSSFYARSLADFPPAFSAAAVDAAPDFAGKSSVVNGLMAELFLPVFLSLVYFPTATEDLSPSFALIDMKIDEDSLACLLLPPVPPTLFVTDCFLELPEPPTLSTTLRDALALIPVALFWQL